MANLGSNDTAVEGESLDVGSSNGSRIAAVNRQSWSTDPGTAINNAVQDLTDGTISSQGGIIELPPGTYTFTTDITYKSGITVEGAGGKGMDSNEDEKGTTLIYEGSGRAIKPANRTTDSWGVSLRDFSVKEGTNGTPTNLLQMDSMFQSNIERMHFEANSSITTVEFNAGDSAGGFFNTIKDSQILGGDLGLYAYSSTGSPLPNALRLFGTRVAKQSTADIKYEDGTGLQIIGGSIGGATTGVKVTSSQATQSIVIVGTRFEGVTNVTNIDTIGFVFFPSSLGSVSGQIHGGEQPGLGSSRGKPNRTGWIRSDAIEYHTFFPSIDSVFDASSGGTVSVDNKDILVESGSGSGDYGRAFRNPTDLINNVTFSRPIEMSAAIDFKDTVGPLYFVTGGVSDSDKTLAHIGFRMANGDIQGTVADGTTETTTTLISGASSGQRVLEFSYNTNSVDFFVDNINQGSITTDLPSGATGNLYTFLAEEDSTTNRALGSSEYRIYQPPE